MSVDIIKVTQDYKDLIEEITSNPNREEQRIQTFLEKRPQFLPNVSRINATTNHGVYSSLIFPKFSLNGTFRRVPDFMYVTKSSIQACVNFVEIEEPSKKMFTENNDFNAEFNHAFQQLEDWRIWLDEGNNKAFLRTELCRAIQHPLMQTLPIVFKFILIYGRRSEYETNDIRKARLSQKSSDPYQIMSFDRLDYSTFSSSLICVKKSDEGYYATNVSEDYDYNHPMRATHKHILRKVDAINSNDYISDERKAELVNKINQLDSMSDEDALKSQLSSFGK